jgi:hypothetical protein
MATALIGDARKCNGVAKLGMAMESNGFERWCIAKA